MTQRQEELLASVSGRMDNLSGLVTEVRQDVKQHGRDLGEVAAKLTALDAKLDGIKDETDTLNHIVRDGNGQPSILSRLATLVSTQEHQADQIEELTENLNAAATAKALTRGQIVVGVIGIVTTFIVSVAGLIVSLAHGK